METRRIKILCPFLRLETILVNNATICENNGSGETTYQPSVSRFLRRHMIKKLIDYRR